MVIIGRLDERIVEVRIGGAELGKDDFLAKILGLDRQIDERQETIETDQVLRGQQTGDGNLRVLLPAIIGIAKNARRGAANERSRRNTVGLLVLQSQDNAFDRREFLARFGLK